MVHVGNAEAVAALADFGRVVLLVAAAFELADAKVGLAELAAYVAEIAVADRIQKAV